MADIVAGQVGPVAAGGAGAGTLRVASGAVGVSIALNAFLGSVNSEDAGSQRTNCAVSSCRT